MATKRKSRKSATRIVSSVQEQMLETLHEIWLAGLGAVSKAQRGAPQLMEDLVKEGAKVNAQARRSTQKALNTVLGGVKETIDTRMDQVRGQASDAFENLEKIFQTRVHRALTQLGVPSAEEVAALSERVDALNANIGKLARARKTGNGSRRPARTRGTTARKGDRGRSAAAAS